MLDTEFDSSGRDFEIRNNRELIAMVRCNRVLYDKIEKLYANANVKTEHGDKLVQVSLTR